MTQQTSVSWSAEALRLAETSDLGVGLLKLVHLVQGFREQRPNRIQLDQLQMVQLGVVLTALHEGIH